MATSVMGYPQETNYCPNCGSSEVEARDMWHQDGLMVCQSCGCRCYVIAGKEEYVALRKNFICTPDKGSLFIIKHGR